MSDTLKISDRANLFADKLKGLITLDSAGVGALDKKVASDLFAEQLPEGLDLKLVREVQQATIDFATGQTKAFADLSLDAMKANKDLDRTSLRSNVEFQRFDNTYQRHRSGTAMGKPWEKFGTVTCDVVLGVGSKSRDLNAVIAYSSTEAEKVFKK